MNAPHTNILNMAGTVMTILHEIRPLDSRILGILSCIIHIFGISDGVLGKYHVSSNISSHHPHSGYIYDKYSSCESKRHELPLSEHSFICNRLSGCKLASSENMFHLPAIANSSIKY